MEMEMGNLYDMNKVAYAKMSDYTDEQIINSKKELTDYFSKGTYFMLLNKERSDYTIFRIVDNPEYAAGELIGCLEDRGVIVDIEKQRNGAYECWIKRSGLAYMYALFPYDTAIIEC